MFAAGVQPHHNVCLDPSEAGLTCRSRRLHALVARQRENDELDVESDVLAGSGDGHRDELVMAAACARRSRARRSTAPRRFNTA
jgi:hypothetical protein